MGNIICAHFTLREVGSFRHINDNEQLTEDASIGGQQPAILARAFFVPKCSPSTDQLQ